MKSKCASIICKRTPVSESTEKVARQMATMRQISPKVQLFRSAGVVWITKIKTWASWSSRCQKTRSPLPRCTTSARWCPQWRIYRMSSTWSRTTWRRAWTMMLTSLRPWSRRRRRKPLPAASRHSWSSSCALSRPISSLAYSNLKVVRPSQIHHSKV